MPLSTQTRLLRVIQEKTFERVGGTETLKIDVRVLTATNRNLEEEVKAGRFREDLYYRLNVIPVVIPPLRERREDIPALVDFALGKCRNRTAKTVRFSKDAMTALMQYDYPGQCQRAGKHCGTGRYAGWLRCHRERRPSSRRFPESWKAVESCDAVRSCSRGRERTYHPNPGDRPGKQNKSSRNARHQPENPVGKDERHTDLSHNSRKPPICSNVHQTFFPAEIKNCYETVTPSCNPVFF